MTQDRFHSNSLAIATATALPGWVFLQWQGDANGTNPTFTLTMTRDMQAKAVFGTYVTNQVIGNGRIVGNPSGQLHVYGAKVQFTAIPGPGSYFAFWANAGSGSLNPMVLQIKTPCPVLTAVFSAMSDTGNQTLTLLAEGGGALVANPATNRYLTGASIQVTATPDEGQEFVGWSGDASGTQNPLLIQLNTSLVITGWFTMRPMLLITRPVFGFHTNEFRIGISGEVGATYQLEATADFSAWTSIAYVTNWSGLVNEVADRAVLTNTQRYYRLKQVP